MDVIKKVIPLIVVRCEIPFQEAAKKPPLCRIDGQWQADTVASSVDGVFAREDMG